MTSRVSSSLLTSCAHHAISCLDLYIRASFVYSCINLNQTSKHRHTKCKQKHRVEYVFLYDGIFERCEFMNSSHISYSFYDKNDRKEIKPFPLSLYHHLLKMFDIPKDTFLEMYTRSLLFVCLKCAPHIKLWGSQLSKVKHKPHRVLFVLKFYEVQTIVLLEVFLHQLHPRWWSDKLI